MKKITIFFILLFVCNSLIYSANQTQTNLESGTYTIGATTAVINLNINENQTITVFKDTLLFEEDFNNFLKDSIIGTSTVIGGENVLTVLPSSMTKMPGCKARTVKVNEENACNIYSTSSKFKTPILSIPNNSKLSFRVKNGDSKSKLTVIDTVFHLGKKADSIKHVYLSNCAFVEFGKIEGEGNKLLIDDIKITSPRDTISHSLNGDTLSLQGLMPETKYYIEILNQDLSVANLLHFSTPSQISNFSAEVVNFDSVVLSWLNNNSLNFLLSINSITNVADDLLISKIACSSSINIVEIYNPTERDICLKDYEFVGYNNSTELNSTSLRYKFAEEDNIKSNSCIIISLNTKISPRDSNLVVYPCVYSSHFSGGNDSYLILKENCENTYDTIDIFGILRVPSDSYNFSGKTLIRKPEIRRGIKHNPANVENVYSEWNIYPYNSENINSILGTHTLNPAIAVHNLENNTLSVGQNSYQVNNVDFDGVYRCQIKEDNNVISTTTFRMGKEINAISNGNWDNNTIWQNGKQPTNLDRVIISSGINITIPQTIEAKCAELVIKSNYSTCDTTNKVEIINNGNLQAEKYIVKPTFTAYTANSNGWTLFGVPINITNKTRQEIYNSFDIGNQDDLYYLKEDYTSDASAWIPYYENVDDSNFFKQNLGYLIAYAGEKELQWEGTLFFEDELILLNNASYNENGGAGFHLCTNPYPFSVNQNNFSKTNIGGIWLLKPETGQYIPEDPNEQSSFMIPPFVGFMTKVNTSENLLKVHKQATVIQAKSSSMIEKLHLNLSYDGGEDDLKIYFREDVTENIDEYDVCKLFSFGSAPDLYSNYSQNNLSIVSLPLWQDSIIIPITYSAKNLSEYVLKMKNIPENVVRAELYDDNELLIDFVEDSVYNFQTLLSNEEKTLILKLYSFDLDVTQEEEMLDFKVIQDKNIVKVISSNEIEELVLYNTKGVKVKESNSNEIIIPDKSCYVLSIKIKGHSYSCKIIYL
jgi:hypothetical protein